MLTIIVRIVVGVVFVGAAGTLIYLVSRHGIDNNQFSDLVGIMGLILALTGLLGFFIPAPRFGVKDLEDSAVEKIAIQFDELKLQQEELDRKSSELEEKSSELETVEQKVEQLRIAQLKLENTAKKVGEILFLREQLKIPEQVIGSKMESDDQLKNAVDEVIRINRNLTRLGEEVDEEDRVGVFRTLLQKRKAAEQIELGIDRIYEPAAMTVFRIIGQAVRNTIR